MGHNSLLDNTIGCFANEFFFLKEKDISFQIEKTEIIFSFRKKNKKQNGHDAQGDRYCGQYKVR